MIHFWPDKYLVCVSVTKELLTLVSLHMPVKYIQIEILLEESLNSTDTLHLLFMTDFAFIQEAQSCRLFVIFDWEQVDPAADSLKMMVMVMIKHLSNPVLVFHHICKSDSWKQDQLWGFFFLLMSGCSDRSLL